LAQGGDGKLSEKALQHQIGSAIDIIVQASRFSDGSRRIAAVAEVLGTHKDGTYAVDPIYEMSRLIKGADGKLKGQLEPTGYVPSFIQEIEDNGIPFARSKFEAA